MCRTQAEAEGLMLLEAENKTGYFGVYHRPGRSKPYQAEVRRGGKKVSLGHFATAEEAAMCIARTPEGLGSHRAHRCAVLAPTGGVRDGERWLVVCGGSSCGACLHVTVARLYGLLVLYGILLTVLAMSSPSPHVQ